VTKDVHPQLFNVVEEMKIAANLPAMPRVYIIDEPAANAFATGRKPEKSAVAVTAGLLSRLNRDELQGVVAHEMSHIVNRDVLFVTFAGVFLGSIVLISEVFLRGLWYSSSSRRFRGSSRSGGGQAQAIIMIVAIVFAILAPLMARLLYFALSRRREYLADASAARLTRYPEGLASALEKISAETADLSAANKVTAPMYIVNPLKKKGRRLSDLTSTHPPISERIGILRRMSQGVGFSSYQAAYSAVKGRTAPIIPAADLRDGEAIPIRKPHSDVKEEPAKKKSARELGDLMRAVNKFAFLMCVCGLKIKLPPEFKKETINCPRCKRELRIPLPEATAVTAAAAAAMQEREKAHTSEAGVYTRKGTGWETFSCSCGRRMQISPVFRGSHLICPKCGQKTEIRPASNTG
jgi:heat shock protein HtpX